MSKLENIVPSLELCKKIPDGEFEDTALVWIDGNTRNPEDVFVEPRRYAIEGTYRPAPTLEEILDAINDIQKWDTATFTRAAGDKTKLTDFTMKRWFDLKEIEEK